MSRRERNPRVDWKKLPKRLALSALGWFLCWYTLFKAGAIVPELLAIAFFTMALVPLFYVYADWINGGPVKAAPDPAAEPPADT